MKTFLLLLLATTGGLLALCSYQGIGPFSSPCCGPNGSDPATVAAIPTVVAQASGVAAPGSGPVPTAGPMMADGDDAIAAQNEILAAPLFARSRTAGGDGPALAVAPGQEQAAAVAQPARLIGVVIAPPLRRALLRFADGTPEWVSEGDATRGWTVRAVSPREAVLAGSGGEMTLDLHAPGP